MKELIKLALQEKSLDLFQNPLRLSNSGKCQRALAYSFLGFQARELPIDTQFDFAIGASIHKYIQSLLIEKGYLVDFEVECCINVNGINIYGHCDGINVNRELIELKTAKDYGIKKAKNGIIERGYLMQMQAYMGALGCKKGKLIYINKSYFLKPKWAKSGVIDDYIIELPVEYNEKIFCDIIEKWKKVIASNFSNIPEPDLTEEDYWQCDYCLYNHICNFKKNL